MKFLHAIFIFLLSIQLYASPNLTLNCPDNVVVKLDPCDDVFILDYSVVNWSSSIQLTDTTYNPAPGTDLAPGMHAASILTTDINGNTDLCNFIISVEVQNLFLICEDLIIVSLEDDCNEMITHDLILEPGGVYCESDLFINVKTQFGEILASGHTVPAQVDWIGLPLTIEIFDIPTGITCWGQLQVTEPTFFELTCPDSKTVLCTDAINPVETGYPIAKNCFPQDELDITFSDVLMQKNCPDTIDYVVTRRWMAENPLGEIKQCEQLIFAKRYELSDVVFPPDFDGTTMPAFECVSGLTPAEIADTSITGYPTVNGIFADILTCDYSVFMDDTYSNLCGESWEIAREWQVFDWCANQFVEHTQTILINDINAPVFEIPNTVFVSSSPDCGNLANLPEADILDECGDISFVVETPWSTLFTNGGDALITQNDGNYVVTYTLTDACGNVSSQTADLIVQPETLVQCPGNISVDCNTYFNDLETPLSNGNYAVLEQFGSPEFHSNCEPDLEISVQIDVDNCGIGTVERTLKTTDFSTEMTCVQNIQIEHQSDFIVTFPEDLTYHCTTSLPNFGEPEIVNADCENIAISYTDTKFNVVPDACYKIVRDWVVINNCIYDENVGNLTVETSEFSLINNPNCDLNGDGSCSQRTFSDGLTADNFPNAQPDGIIEYQQVIKVIDDFEPEFLPYSIDPICIQGNTCSATVNIPIPEFTDCSEVEFFVSTSLPGGNGFGPYLNVPSGTFNVNITAIDECNNSSSLNVPVVVLDCEKPTPYCKNGLVVDISQGQNGEIEMYASDFDAGSFDNCPGVLGLSFSANENEFVRTFDCDDIGQQNVTIWVTDATGNQDFCNTFLILEDEEFYCQFDQSVYGLLRTKENEGVGLATVYLETPLNGIYDSLITDDNGYFMRYGPPDGLIITPEKDINITNGVTTFDIVLLQKHILFVQLLDCPYRLIAADVNNSGSITVSDAVAMKKVILFIEEAFPNNKSWRFVHSGYVFPNPQNPWEEVFPESRIYYIDNPESMDFVGIKIGDLNGNANPSQFQNSDDRNFAGTIDLNLPNINFEKGETIVVPFKINRSDLVGYQFTVDFDESVLELLNIENGFSDASDFGKRYLKEGILTTSRTVQNGTISTEKPLFSLTFKAKTAGTLSNLIKLRSDYAQPEAYSRDLEILNIKLNFSNLEPQNTFALYPNQPNPFSESTLIPFYLPNDEWVEFKLFNAGGQLIKSARNFHQKGYNQMEINEKDLRVNGIYYFRMIVKKDTKTGRMVKAG